jgi:DNA-binding beta-propeller fold protein YncE
MATTDTLQEQRPAQGGDEDRSSRRLLKVLLWILAIAALALLALLIWLLWPKSTTPPGQAAGYPIEVVTTIYGYGDQPEERIETPLGVAFDDQGNVWISNTGKSRVEQYTTDGEFVRLVGADGEGQLLSPYGLTVDPSRDRVYVADYGRGMVQVFTTAGGYVTHFPADDQDLGVFGEGFTPYDVQVVDGRVVVASNDGLYSFDDAGNVVGRWGARKKGKNIRGPQFGEFNFPDSFAVDPDSGTYYVADTMNRRVVALSPEGQWLWVSGTPDAAGQTTGFWQLPRSVEIGPDGNLYVVDTFRADEDGMGTGHIVVLSPEGELLSEFGRTGSVDGAFSFPDQIAFDSGELWAMADRENHRVVIFRLKTPYPTADEIEAEKYQGAVSHPFEAWSSPKSERTTTSP